MVQPLPHHTDDSEAIPAGVWPGALIVLRGSHERLEPRHNDD